MLKKLYIRNYALINELETDFHAGLNIITGETGAGKSIIIGAMGLLLGDRAQKDSVRQGAEKAVVEGVFYVPKAAAAEAVKNLIELDRDELIIRREVFSNGRSRAFVNDSPVTGAVLSQIGNSLADLHGQHAHQALLNADTHIRYLDSFGMDKDLLDKLNDSFSRFTALNRKLEKLVSLQKTAKEKQELLQFQVKQISDADPKPGEEEELEKEDKILSNAEKIFQTAAELQKMLYEGENSVSENLSQAVSLFTTLVRIDPGLEKWQSECDSARIAVEEISIGLSEYVSSVEFDPEKLQEIRDRLGLFSMLKKKYGTTIEEVLNFFNTAKDELDSIENVEEQINSVKLDLSKEISLLTDFCISVSEMRMELAKKLELRIEESLRELGLGKAVFNVKLIRNSSDSGPVVIDNVRYNVTSDGIDKAEFFISLNSGESIRPLAKVASGGEISRIMLSLKKVFAETDQIPVLIFDEIDSGISGRIARIVGKKLKEVSLNHQVICITHLPQIASLGDAHYSVSKNVDNGRTLTNIRILSDNERVAEIAKLLGGESVTESALQSARELIFEER
ncbi:DNA repair protein RecN [bacterium]|nr:DNA repair protein RecN [bacterium]